MAANLAEVTVPMPSSAPQERAQAALAAANALQIVTADDYRQAAQELQALAAKEKEIDEARVKLKKPIDEAAKAVQAFFKPPLDFLAQAKTVIKTKLVAWDQEQERIRRAEQARLDEIARQERLRREAEAAEAARKAREKADAERKAAEEKRRAEEAERRKAQEAENARLKAERDAAEARARGDREARERAEQEAKEARERAAAAEKAARDAAAAATRLETRATTTEQRGAERAEALQAQAATVVAPIVQAEIPKVSGISNRDNWKAEGFDLMATVKAVAAGQASVVLLAYNEKVLGQQARSLKEHFVAPGIRVWNDKTKAAGAA